MTIFFPETALDAVARYADEREEAERAARRLVGRLAAYDEPNRRQLGYYTGKHTLHDLGISTPPAMRDLPVVAGWPAIVVDTLEERLDLLGWQTSDLDDDDLQLAQIFAANNLDTESSLGHLDALIYGIAFAVVGSGPTPLVTVESPSLVTVTWDARRRTPDSAVVASPSTDSFGPTRANVYLPGRRLLLERPTGTEAWAVVDRESFPDEIVPVVPLVNRPHASAYQGRSEITRPVRYLTDAAMRTLLGAEVNREFYAAPQRWAMGASEESFIDSNQARVGEWQAIMGRVWAMERDEDGNLPSVGQFPATSPQPFIEQIKLYAQLLAAQAGMPAAYLGFVTDNPASADAIRAGEARLVKRAERRQAAFGQAWAQVARLAILLRDGEIPPEADAVRSRWRDAATPTRAASADEAAKLVGSGILPADSQVTYDRIGLTPGEQDRVQSEARRKLARETTRLLLSAGQSEPGTDGLSG